MRETAGQSPHDGPIGIRAVRAVTSELHSRREFESKLWSRLMDFVEVEGLKDSFRDLLAEDDPRRTRLRSFLLVSLFLATLLTAIAIFNSGKLPFLAAPASPSTQLTQEHLDDAQPGQSSAECFADGNHIARLERPKL